MNCGGRLAYQSPQREDGNPMRTCISCANAVPEDEDFCCDECEDAEYDRLEKELAQQKNENLLDWAGKVC